MTNTGQAPSGTPLPTDIAWSASELSADPHRHSDKATKVRRMFAAISGAYDLNNRVHSFGRDQAWRRVAVRASELKPTDHVLDVACGTGDLSLAFARRGAARVVGLDFTPQMLDIARQKLSRSKAARGATIGPASVEFIEGDAMALPFGDSTFDVVSIAFGIRNVTDTARALREFRRVLRPGGRLIILEFGRPSPAPIAWLNDLYCSVIMPRTATLIAGDRSGAYHYLPRSVRTFLSPEELAGSIRAAGFGGVISRRLTFGVCVCTRADVPS